MSNRHFHLDLLVPYNRWWLADCTHWDSQPLGKPNLFLSGVHMQVPVIGRNPLDRLIKRKSSLDVYADIQIA